MLGGNMKSWRLVLLIFCMGFVGFLKADLPDRKNIVKLSQAYKKAMDVYFSTDFGKLEYQAKNALRNAYLACGVSDDELMCKLSVHLEVVRRLKEWKRKCGRGLHQKTEPSVSVDDFISQAQSYAMLHKQVSQSPEYKKHRQAHHEYKKLVLHLLNKGVKVDQINKVLNEIGIENERILSRTEYWRKKDL